MEEKLQRTPEWADARKYRFTSSCIYKLLTEPKSAEAKRNGELSETTKSYILEKIALEVGGAMPEFENAATRWGNEHEQDAKDWYQITTGNRIADVQFCEANDFYGGSPDSAVIDVTIAKWDEQDVINGALEIKCPYNSANHLKHVLIDSDEAFKKIAPEYYWQCLSHIITLKVDWCDFVSFDPRIDHDCGLFIYRLWKNEDDALLLLSKLDKANQYKSELKARLKIF